MADININADADRAEHLTVARLREWLNEFPDDTVIKIDVINEFANIEFTTEPVVLADDSNPSQGKPATHAYIGVPTRRAHDIMEAMDAEAREAEAAGEAVADTDITQIGAEERAAFDLGGGK